MDPASDPPERQLTSSTLSRPDGRMAMSPADHRPAAAPPSWWSGTGRSSTHRGSTGPSTTACCTALAPAARASSSSASGGGPTLPLAGGPQGLLARALRGRPRLRRGDGPHGADRPRGPDPARQPAGRPQLRRARGIRIMVMEWIDGYDLARLLAPACSGACAASDDGRWDYINHVIVTDGPRSRGSSPAWQSPCSATAWRRWRPCTATVSCMATSSRRTSC